MDRGTWWATAHGVPESRTRLSDWARRIPESGAHGSVCSVNMPLSAVGRDGEGEGSVESRSPLTVGDGGGACHSWLVVLSSALTCLAMGFSPVVFVCLLSSMSIIQSKSLLGFFQVLHIRSSVGRDQKEKVKCLFSRRSVSQKRDCMWIATKADVCPTC